MSETDLEKWPRPSVAVDVALLTVVPNGRQLDLRVLIHERGRGYGVGQWSLPGTFMHEGECLDQTALRALRDKVGVRGEQPQQLRVFDDPDRDDRGRVLSVAHVDLVSYARLEGVVGDACQLAPVDGEPPLPVVAGCRGGLLFDHDDIVVEAVKWARAEYADRPDPMRLLGDEFTLYELQRLHEAVLGVSLPKDRWRRAMEDPDRGLLSYTGREKQGSVGKPARLFKRARRRP